MDGDEPQMRDGRFEDGVDVFFGVEPVEEGLHFIVEKRSRGGFVVNLLVPDRAGDDLHRPGFVVRQAPT